jgi:hypothetical protein
VYPPKCLPSCPNTNKNPAPLLRLSLRPSKPESKNPNDYNKLLLPKFKFNPKFNPKRILVDGLKFDETSARSSAN